MGLHRVRHNWSNLAAAAAELKKVPIEDTNLDKSLVKRDHIWESQYPQGPGLKVP